MLKVVQWVRLKVYMAKDVKLVFDLLLRLRKYTDHCQPDGDGPL